MLAILACCSAPATPPAPPARPARIASQLVLADEILWRLGPDVRARVIAVSKLADEPRYSGVRGLWPETLPRLAESSELLVNLSPDLAIVASFSSPEVRALLARSGAAVVELDRFGGFADYRANVRRLAAATDATDAGEEVVRSFEARLALLQQRRRGPALRVISWNEGIVAGRGTSFDDAARAAGFVNAADIDGHQRATSEQLVAWSPELVVTGCADSCAAAVARLSQDVALRATPAVKNGAVAAIQDRTVYSPGEGMLDLVEALIDAPAARP